MTTRRSAGGGKAKIRPGQDKADKKFKVAMQNLEKIAQERMLLANDPFSAGVKMAGEIRKLAERIESEVESVTSASTEAAYTGYDTIGVGVGVS
jgi:hypothetical protein